MAAVCPCCVVQPWRNPTNGGLAYNSLMDDYWLDRTPLHEAAFQGRFLQLGTLLAQGFHVDSLTIDRVSPLHEACLGGHFACAKFLLDSGANANEVTTDGATPLFNSCRSRSADCVRLLLQHGASVHTIHPLASPIHEAAKNGHRECLELLLLSSGAPIDMELPEVGTALYSACQAQAAACVEVLLHSGADVHAGRGLESPLHAAVRGGGSNVVELLLDFGADRWCRNAEGRTPLDLSLPNSAVRVTLQKRGSCSLFQLCRLCIRRSLGRSRLHKASSLNLPNSITDYLLHR
ncbi:ankyrin repeat and SOCS box protein 11 isoform 1-T1 [Odontesthes bonariensis]|uniref:ankyrin repeat and SOCS box protein 11 n=1 Tax=Odontesthes bonariensis TaxID=219752 RepID=UPI003F58935A